MGNFMAAGVTIGSSQQIFGPYFDPLEATFGWNRTQISAFLSFSALGGLAAPLLGRLILLRRSPRAILAFAALAA